MASFSQSYSHDGNGVAATVSWSCSPGATSAYVTLTMTRNDYGNRSLEIVSRSDTTKRYGTAGTLSVGSEYWIYIYRAGTYNNQMGPFKVVAPYSVTYNANGGSGAPSSQEKKPGTNLTLSSTKPSWTGHTFLRWSTNSAGTGTTYNPGGSYTSDADLSLYAIWQLDTYSVSYDANGGTNAPDGQTKTYGSNLTLTTSTPSRTGYTFSTWNTQADGKGIDYGPGATYTDDSELRLYAIWTINKWPVTYDANGGSGAPGNQTKTYNQTLTLSTTKPTLTGYTFKEWNTRADGKGTAYSSGGSYTGNTRLDLFAIWTPIQYTVKFNANGGSGSMSDQTMTYNQSANLTSNGFTWSGHTFLGWAETSTGAVKYQNGASVKNLRDTAGASITLYAKWSINQITITFDAATNGGQTVEASRAIDYGASLGTLPSASRQYYAFVGWFTSPTGGTQISTTRTFTQSTTIYAQFVIDSSVIAKILGVWRKGIPYINVKGVWKKGYAWVKANGEWKQGIG